MFAVERQQQIARRLKERGRVGVADLAREFDASTETIRRDLATLEDEGHLRRVHGGAVDAARVGAPEPTMAARGTIRIAEKRRIARAALALVPTAGTIFLESASTSQVLADALAESRSLTIVTNGLPVALALAARDFDVVMVGGRVRNRSLATLDDWGEPGLAGIRVDVAFLGTLSISLQAGLTAVDPGDAAIKRRCLGLAEKTVLLAESAKFGAISPFRYGDLSALDAIVTDAGLADAQAQDIRAQGIDLVLA